MNKYAIIGAAAAGLSCAEKLRELDGKSEITIYTEENYYPYSRPLISYYLKGITNPEKMLLKSREFYEEKKISIVTGCKIVSVDSKKKIISDGKNDYAYDKLLLASGSNPFLPPMEGVDGMKNTSTFMSLADAEKIKAMADSSTRAVVVGAGLIGLKAAEGLSEICKSVCVVELAPKVLPSILNDESAEVVKEHLNNNGIYTILGDTVVRAESDDGIIKSVKLKSGKTLDCDLLVLAVGVRPRTDIAEKAGCELGRGIVTDPDTMQTTVGDIYAAGDCVESVDMLDGNKKPIALWPNAVKQGEIAAYSMAGVQHETEHSFAVNAIDFHGLRICTCGLYNAENAQKLVCADDENKKYKYLTFKDGCLIGYVLINCSERAGIYTSLIENKVPIDTLSGDLLRTPEMMMFEKAERKQKLTGGTRI